MHGVRHCLWLNTDDDALNPEKILQIHDFLVFWDQFTVFLQFTLFSSLATLSDAPEGDLYGHAIVGYT